MTVCRCDWVPDRLWSLAQPLIPQFQPRPQGGGNAPLSDRAGFAAPGVNTGHTIGQLAVRLAILAHAASGHLDVLL